ncbi:XdhC family protein [Euzebya tangerina]|uniref:XdhC family protein n=1 Tax=Euzebya tangerina TaxID=591198 RepID=UPI000E323202|nr:XdhC family protein [Euzebya tangerina]
MREILTELDQWHAAGRPAALATVVNTRISAPRDPGAAMAVNADGIVVGSVSGGCVEGAVVEQAREVLDGGPARQVTYGVSDDEAMAVGLTCGGEISLFIEPFDIPEFDMVRDRIREGIPVAVATVVDGPGLVGSKLVVTEDAIYGDLGSEGLGVAVSSDARGLLAQGRTAHRGYGSNGERRVDDVTVFIQSFQPPPRMYVFGAIDFAAAVARIGKFLGYHVTVCDARRVFATKARFPEADEVVVQWPHRFLPTAPVDSRTALCVLTHDPKFDVPLLEVALATEAGYIGAMGSRRTHDDRMARLRELGVPEAQLARLRSPIGLDLGARTPEETAVSIAAEITQLRWGGSGRPLTDTEGRIHPDAGDEADEVTAGTASSQDAWAEGTLAAGA